MTRPSLIDTEINEYRLLLIDDDEDEYIHIRHLLSQAVGQKFTIQWCSTYESGLGALMNHKYDLCLLDQKLGAQTGLDLLVEAGSGGLSCPVILLTGQSDFELDLRAMQMGAADYLVKDQLTAPLLERTIRYAIKRDLDMQELKENKAVIIQQDRLASLGLLASSLAHEIGTPLSVIRSRAELAARRQPALAPLAQDMDVIIAQIDRISKLVHSLLNLAREKKTDHLVQVNLNSIIEDVTNLIKHELNRKDILLKNDIVQDYVLWAEEGPFGQVLLNLIINSIHAIEEARKQGRKDGHQITLAAHTLGEFVSLSILDTGCGIGDKNKNQLFKPFFTTKDIGSGTGLGLATSKKIIQSWGGDITVRSEPGRFAEFHVLIPRDRPNCHV